MEERPVRENRSVLRKLVPIAITMAALLLALALPVMSWFITSKKLLAYAPVTSPEALYIGAGHRDISNGTFEDIRYLYFDGINVADEYSDYVFCVYGTAISGFYLQLGFTTNNQFVYEIYVASESETPPPDPATDYVDYIVHDGSNKHYYYTIDNTVNGGDPISGTYLNLDTTEYATSGQMLANESRVSHDYGEYTNINRFAKALYWQTDSAIDGDTPELEGDQTYDFVVYFILRVNTNGKTSNDRETDILCISVKSVTVVD